MAINMEPNRKLRIVLGEGDSAPIFHVMAPKFRTTLQLSSLLQELQGVDGNRPDGLHGMKILGQIADAVRHLLVGWENVYGEDGEPVEFDPSRLEDGVGLDDVAELAAEIFAGCVPSDEDKKKSG